MKIHRGFEAKQICDTVTWSTHDVSYVLLWHHDRSRPSHTSYSLAHITQFTPTMIAVSWTVNRIQYWWFIFYIAMISKQFCFFKPELRICWIGGQLFGQVAQQIPDISQPSCDFYIEYSVKSTKFHSSDMVWFDFKSMKSKRFHFFKAQFKICWNVAKEVIMGIQVSCWTLCFKLWL